MAHDQRDGATLGHVMDSGGASAVDGVDDLLEALDEADASLRALYRLLAEDPDLAGEHEPKLKELHARRLDLAQRVGLATLARRRATAHVVPPENVPSVIETSSQTVDGNGAAAEGVVEPEPPPEDPSPPSAPPASDAQLAQWKSSVRTNGLGSGLRTASSSTTAWPLVLHGLMETVGPPRDHGTSVATVEEIDGLDEVSTDDRQQQWVRLPKHVQQLWLSMLVARTRVLKESPSWTETKDRLKAITGRYPPWAKAHTPGHVNGMQLKHMPMQGSWAQDAQHLWDALADLLGEERVVVPPEAAKKRPKRAVGDEEETPDIDPSWRLLPLVRGRRAEGGHPRRRPRASRTGSGSNAHSSSRRWSGPQSTARARSSLWWRAFAAVATAWSSCSSRSSRTSKRTGSSRPPRRWPFHGRSSKGTASRL